MDNKRKCYLYARVSTLSEEQATSFNAQTKYKSDDYNIVEVFADQGKTGTKILNRKSFCEMLYRCNIDIKEIEGNILFLKGDRIPEVNLIIVSHTSRFMRNQLLMKQLLLALKKNGVEVIFLDMGKSSFDTDIDFVMNILFLLDEQESKNTSLKVKRGLEKAREQRQYLHVGFGGMLGFNYIKEENKLVKNKDSKIVEQIFIDYVENKLSMRDLADKYNRTADKIRRILMNERYCGHNAYHKYTLDDNGKRVRQSEYDTFESTRIEPIISEELFLKAKDIRLSRRNSNNGGKCTDKYSLSSKIHCKNCGGIYFHKATNKKGDTWSCITKHNSRKCDSPNINEDKIIKYVEENIDNFEKQTEQLINFSISKIKTVNISILKKELLELNEKKEKLLDLYINNNLSKEIYLKKSNVIETQINSIKSDIDNAINIENSLKYLNTLSTTYTNKFNYFRNILSIDKYKILDEISSVTITKHYNSELDRIEPLISSLIFNGFEELNKLSNSFKLSFT